MKRLIAIPLVLGIVIVILAGVLWLRKLAPEEHTFRLSTGAVMTFRQATFGRNHVVAAGPRWHRFVPAFLARWLKVSKGASSFTTASPSVVLWFEKTWTPGGGPGYACSIVHSDGSETPFDDNHFFANYSPTNSLEGTPSAFPQREKSLRIRFYERIAFNDVVPLGEFTISNPRVSRTPPPNAPPLPQTARDRNLQVSLVSLEAGVRRGLWQKANVLNQWTRAQFHVLEDAVPSDKWLVQQMIAVDSTGNRLVSRSWSSSTSGTLERFECQPVLWPSEAYKLRFEFSRKPEAAFETSELWSIRDVAVPADGEFTLVNTQRNIGNYAIRFHGLTAKDGRPPWDRMMSGDMALGFSVTPPLDGYRFTLISVTDDRARKVELSGSGSSSSNWGFGLRVKDAIHSVNVTVALHQSRFVEFQARPVKWDGKFSP